MSPARSGLFGAAMTLRVMTYNIGEGAVGREEELLQVIRAAAPDLLLMQEVLNHKSARPFARSLGMTMYFAPSNARTRNIALFSRLPIVHGEAYHPFPLLRTLLLATIRLRSGEYLNLFGVHLGLIYDLWRCYELAVILRKARGYSEHYRGAFSIMAGDFNSVAPGEPVAVAPALLLRAVLALQFRVAPRLAIRLIERCGYQDCYRLLHRREEDMGFTALLPSPLLRLDYIFASPTLAARLSRCEVLRTPAAVHSASDHYPLLAEFDI